MSSEGSASPAGRGGDLLLRLRGLPRLTVPVTALVLLLVGMFAPTLYAVPALALLTGFIAWLASVSWPALDGAGRLLRVAAIGALIGVFVSRLLAG